MEKPIEASDVVEILRQYVDSELSKLQPPQSVQTYLRKLESVHEEAVELPKGISDAEYRFVLALQSNLSFRRRELDWAVGMMLLFSELGPDTPYFGLFEIWQVSRGRKITRAEYNFDYWRSVGDCTGKICSFLDALGGYLAFIFFGLTEHPLYFHQVVDSLRGKYSWSFNRKRDRIPLVQEGDPFNLDEFIGWEILWEARKHYQNLKAWRNVLIHNFSPLLRTKIHDVEDSVSLDSLVPFLADRSASEVKTNLIEHYFFAKLARMAVVQIAEAYCATSSYHRDFYHDAP